MRDRVGLPAAKAVNTNRKSESSHSLKNSGFSLMVWLLRIVLSIVLILIIMPIALLLTPWWIWLQLFERKCPDMMDGYFRIVTWPLTLSKKIRGYQRDDQFVEQLKY